MFFKISLTYAIIHIIINKIKKMNLKFKLPAKLDFLKSIRFWKLVLIAIVQVLVSMEIITTEVATGLIIILGGSVALRTLDKFHK